MYADIPAHDEGVETSRKNEKMNSSDMQDSGNRKEQYSMP